MPVTLSQAEKIVSVARAHAEAAGLKMSIAVVDERGDLIAFGRMDGARFYTAVVAHGKAMASAYFGQPSAALAERAGTPFFQSMMQMSQGRLVLLQGAVPITKDGQNLGAVGCSGGSSQQDEDVAKAGLTAL